MHDPKQKKGKVGGQSSFSTLLVTLITMVIKCLAEENLTLALRFRGIQSITLEKVQRCGLACGSGSRESKPEDSAGHNLQRLPPATPHPPKAL